VDRVQGIRQLFDWIRSESGFDGESPQTSAEALAA
jgi:hypothetical protein